MVQVQNSIEEVPVIVVGAGPVGMLLAYQLDQLGVPCLLAERSLDTTKWPKMDLTNCRSMELLRVLGLADEYRSLEGSVDPGADFNSFFVTLVVGEGKLLGAWRRQTVPEQREFIAKNNDGSQPAEPGHRCMQILFEAWLKDIILERTKVRSRFGWKYLSHIEDVNGVVATFVDIYGLEHTVRSKYLVGCDGGSSRARKTAGIKMIGGQIPARFYLVHLRSQELAERLSFGRSWHTFPIHAGFLIDQDGRDTFTAHYPINKIPFPANGRVDPHEVVYRTLGGPGEQYKIKIDQVLVHSEWTPNFSLAEKYHTDSLRVLLAGDAAHRMPPHGGYGMNSGVLDAIDLSWRLAALHKSYGGPLLLRSYNTERRAMTIRSLERALRHLIEHVKLSNIYEQHAEHLEANMLTTPRTVEHDWDVKYYRPSTRPGCRVPHVFLKDGITSTYDVLGGGGGQPEWTFVQFVDNGSGHPSPNPNTSFYTACIQASDLFLSIAQDMKLPLKRIILQDETHAHRVWESRDLVLVRPDTHVAWRGYVKSIYTRPAHVREIFDVVSGNGMKSCTADSSGGAAAAAAMEVGFRALVEGFTDMHVMSNSATSTIVGE